MNDPEGPKPHGSQEKALTRRVNPAGFVLALLLFLFLPCLAVSCDAPGSGSTGPWSVDISFSGADVARDKPKVETAGGMARTPAWEEAYSEQAIVMDPLARVLAVVTAIAMVVGVGTIVARTSRRRSLTAATVAVVAGVLLVVTELLASSQLETAVRNLVSGMLSGARDHDDVVSRVGDVVSTGPGFWFSLTGLVLIAALNVVVLLRSGRHEDSVADF